MFVSNTVLLIHYDSSILRLIDDDYEWISTNWLRTWLNSENRNIPPIDNTVLTCKHSRTDPSKMHLMKRVSAEAADVLFSQYGGLPRLQSDSLCTTCSDFIKRKSLFESKLQEDMKVLGKPLRATYK